jgi:SHS2 domain-containing protein
MGDRSQVLPWHEVRQHTSEVEFRVRARSLGDLLAEAGRALAEVELAGNDGRPDRQIRTIEVTSPDRDALVIDWLNELIALADIARWVATDFSIQAAENTEVRAQAAVWATVNPDQRGERWWRLRAGPATGRLRHAELGSSTRLYSEEGYAPTPAS